MGGTKNDTGYQSGYNIYPTQADDILVMQQKTDAVQLINVTANPEGNENGNPGSLALDSTNGKLYRKESGTGNTGWKLVEGDGNVNGVPPTTDNAIVRWDGVLGDIIQNSVGTITDAGVCDGLTQLNVDNLRLDGNTVSSTSGNLDLAPTSAVITQDQSASVVRHRMQNTDSTAADRDCHHSVQTHNSSTGVPYYSAMVSLTHAFSWGIDHQDANQWKLVYAAGTSNPTFTGGTDQIIMSTAGEMNLPLQPAFMAILGTSDSNVTGDGTAFTIGSGNALTEIFDQNSDFVTTGTFTAPVTGRYRLGYNFMLQAMVAAINGTNHSIVTSNRTYTIGNDAGCFSGNNAYHYEVFADMDAGDTATFRVSATGGTKIVDLFGGGSRTNVYGELACQEKKNEIHGR